MSSLVRVHHALGDGTRLMEALLQCQDDPTLLRRAHDEVVRAMGAHTKPAVSQGVLATLTGHIATWWTMTATAWRLVTARQDPVTCLRPRRPVQRLDIASSRTPWPLADIKATAAALGGGTVNDVMLSVVSGTLRRLLLQHHTKVDHMTLQCHLAVNMMPLASAPSMGNLASAISCPLGVGVADGAKRFLQVKRDMTQIKQRKEAYVASLFMGLSAHAPPGLLPRMVNRISAQASCVVSNLPGPAFPISLCARQVRGIRWFLPPFGSTGLGISMLSYNGMMQVSMTVDDTLCFNALDVERAMGAEIVAMQQLKRATSQNI